jgi:hypothetical protein
MRQTRRWWWIGFVLGLLALTTLPVDAQNINTQIAIAINNLVTGVTPFTAFRTATSSYLNWGSTQGMNGYGLRDSGGQIQVKDSGGAWTPVISASGAPTSASYITRVSEAGLTNETALSGIATALLQNTTGTGVLSAYAGTSCTNQYLNALSAVGAGTCATVNVITETTGTLPVNRGGTNLTSGTSGGILGFTAAGTIASSAALTANAIVLGGGAGATPTVLGSLGTTTTLLHGNAAGAPTFAAVTLTTDVTGILPGANGGTGNGFFAVSGPAASLKTFTFPNASTTILTTNAAVTAVQGGTGLAVYAVGDLIQANTTTTLARLAAVSTGNALISGGGGVVSSWGKIGLTTHVTGTLPVANGGTGLASYTTGMLLHATAATTIAGLADVAAGSFLRSAGVGVAPAYSTTVWTNTATTGDLLGASAANTYSNIAAVALGQTLISQGVTTLPIWSSALRISTIALGPNLTFSSAAPTISAGFGAGASVTAGTSAAFRVDVGAASMSGTVGLPTAATGWNCSVENLTATTANRADATTVQLSSTTATAVLESQTVSTGAAVNWGANDILAVSCTAF